MLKISIAEFVAKRFHYELDTAHESYSHALSRMEDGDFERGYIAGLERAMYLLQDTRDHWRNNNYDPLLTEEDDDGGGDSSEGSGGGESGSGEGSGSGSGDTSGGGSGDSDNDFDMPLDAVVH